MATTSATTSASKSVILSSADRDELNSLCRSYNLTAENLAEKKQKFHIILTISHKFVINPTLLNTLLNELVYVCFVVY